MKYERLKELLHYDPESGIFTWKVSRGTVKYNSTAGSVNSRGYILIKIDGVKYLAHRLAWLYVYGYCPENIIDHIDRDKLNNKIINLREVSRSCNVRNSNNRKDNTSGVKGVYWSNIERRWKSSISINNETKHLGTFNTLNDAVKARYEAEQTYDWIDCDSKSSAYKYLSRMEEIG